MAHSHSQEVTEDPDSQERLEDRTRSAGEHMCDGACHFLMCGEGERQSQTPLSTQ